MILLEEGGGVGYFLEIWVCDCIELMKFQCFVYQYLSEVPEFLSPPDCICWKNGG